MNLPEQLVPARMTRPWLRERTREQLRILWQAYRETTHDRRVLVRQEMIRRGMEYT